MRSVLSSKTSVENLAPALSNKLDRLGLDFVSVKSLIGQIFDFGYLEAPQIKRVEGASFNPRIARVIQIFMSNVPGFNCSDIMVASLASINIPIKEINVPEEISHRVAAIKSGNGEKVDQEIFCAILLDDMRHLHLSTSTIEEKKIFIQKTEDLVKFSLSNNPTVVEQIIRAMIQQKRLFRS